MNRYFKYKRTVEDALEVVVHAKHSVEDIEPLTQVFNYPSENDCLQSKNSQLRLIQLNEDMVKLLEDGERLVFRGTEKEKLVICSEDATYEVKEGETSNALFLTPDLSFHGSVAAARSDIHVACERQIAGILDSYLEFRPTFPKLQKLRNLLNDSRYKGPDKEEECSNRGYYVCELLDVVQCSRNELMAGLKDLPACNIDGKWRLIDVEYETNVLSTIINAAETMAWIEIPKKECCEKLQCEIPLFILDYIFNFMLQQIGQEDLYSWRQNEVCRSFALMLLMAGAGKFRYNEFIMSLTQCLPEGLEPDINCLKGLAIISFPDSRLQTVELFPEWSLPEDIPERFRQLFKKKATWTLEEIQPYIEKLATRKMNISTMLTKYSRASTKDGIRVYSSRYAE